eukprot:CAMPEP_0176452892 /NCGR_PEP_ID=MMETSP0127-20121128/28860_1 /TAXON_ID=938130 /ORGANISM="Platyophrya macrostoma, Strain WH" /LENGTH=62 /DNA_ID=CAMNT_0017841541 /DNA_START=219 /DNA_END=404 /DNA_ORIENTATION=-
MDVVDFDGTELPVSFTTPPPTQFVEELELECVAVRTESPDGPEVVVVPVAVAAAADVFLGAW